MTEEKKKETESAEKEQDKKIKQAEEKPGKAPAQKPALSPEWTLFSRYLQRQTHRGGVVQPSPLEDAISSVICVFDSDPPQN